MCHHNTFMLYSSMKNTNEQKWGTVTHISVGTSLLVSLVFSLVGYATFTGFVQGTNTYLCLEMKYINDAGESRKMTLSSRLNMNQRYVHYFLLHGNWTLSMNYLVFDFGRWPSGKLLLGWRSYQSGTIPLLSYDTLDLPSGMFCCKRCYWKHLLLREAAIDNQSTLWNNASNRHRRLCILHFHRLLRSGFRT